MPSTESDKNAREHYTAQQLQHLLKNDLCCNSQMQCSFHVAKRTRKATTTKTTSHPSSQSQMHHLLQRCIRVLPLIQYTAMRLSKCCWLGTCQLFPSHNRKSASYQQQSSTAISKRKIIKTRHIFISRCTTNSTFNSHRHHQLQKLYLTRSSSLVLLTLLLMWFSHLIGSSCAAPQSCVLCDISDFKDQASNAHAYEEYHFEHQVTRMEAITALKMFNVSDYGEPSGCAMSCSDKVMKYCLGQQFINDHCWCELGHTEEGLPFVPHVCYVGEKLYKATVGSCYFYEQVKECCCAPVLAKQWRHISVATRHINSGSLLLLTILLLFFTAACRQTYMF